jgi:hypothetical protein
MALAEQLAKAATAQPKGPTCVMCLTVPTLSKEDRAALDAAMDSDIAHTAIARALQAEGYNVKATSVARHRRYECATREPV